MIWASCTLAGMLFAAIAATSAQLTATSKRSEKSALLAATLRQLAPAEIAPAVGMLTGVPRQGRLGVGWRTLRSTVGEVAPAPHASLAVGEVDDLFERLGSMSGAGVNATRAAALRDVFGRATEAEQQMLWRIIGGELRQGALDGVMLDAVARAAEVPIADVRRAHMMSGSLGDASVAALTGGQAALADVTMQPGRAVQPMLAAPSNDVVEALATIGGPASVEWKLDGARIQAHRRDGVIHLYTRNLNDITERLAAVVSVVATLPGGDLVLDGEVLGVTDDGAPRRFQDTMGDFAAGGGDRARDRQRDARRWGAGPQHPERLGSDATGGRGHRLLAFFFDVLHAGGESVVDEPLAVRRQLLSTVVPPAARLASIVTADPAEAAAFLDRAIDAGHEGVMVKALDAPYDAGRRGGAWRKVKPVHTLDLVVLAVEWGHGRRSGWLSNLHLGARGDVGLVMVGKTFKGMTDELLAWQTERFQQLAISTEDGYIVHVRPEVVVEIALDGVQVSTRYPGGVALRFARVRRYREDKAPAEADHISTVQAMLR